MRIIASRYGSAVPGNTADAPEASTVSPFPVETQLPASTLVPVVSVSLTTNRTAPQPIGNAIGFTATPTGGVAPYVYKWFIFMGTTWTASGDWTSSANFSWYPTEPNSTYRIRVWVKGAANTADQAEASAEEAFAITGITAPEPPAPAPPSPPSPPAPAPPAPAPPAPAPPAPVSAVTLTSSKSSPQPPGTAILFTAQPVGGVGPYQYQWLTYEDDKWTAVGSWGTLDTLTWSRNTPGDYKVLVAVRSAGSTVEGGRGHRALRAPLNFTAPILKARSRNGCSENPQANEQQGRRKPRSRQNHPPHDAPAERHELDATPQMIRRRRQRFPRPWRQRPLEPVSQKQYQRTCQPSICRVMQRRHGVIKKL